MITCLAALIFLAIIIHTLTVTYDDTQSIPITIIITIISSSIIALLGGMVLAISASFFTVPTEEPYTETKPIYALQDNITTTGSISGGIFYTTGYIDSELSYFYLTSTDSGLKSEHIPADTTYIKISDNPRLEITYANYELSWIGKILFFPINTSDTAFQNHTLYIPEESITNSFSIDLEN